MVVGEEWRREAMSVIILFHILDSYHSNDH